MRIAFPDIAWLWYAQGVSLSNIESRMIEIGNMLSPLLQRDLSFDDLRDLLEIDEMDLITDLTLLLALKHVMVTDKELWRLNIPILTQRDYENIRSLSRSMLGAIASKFKNKLSTIKELYSKTTPAKNDIPVEEAFNQIYHLVFEKALNTLIRSKIIEEPSLRPDNGKYSAFMIILE